MKEKIFINARIIDPSQNMDEKGSLILNEEGKVITKGQQIQIGGNESYISLCRLHWCEEIENANINDYQS